MKYLSILFSVLSVSLCGISSHAQVYAQLKLWDSHLRYPKINEIEFEGADSSLATYDAIYGHGAMWESPYVGFRIYMDHRQSIDLYGKQHPQLELDSTNFYSNHEWMAKGYGEDILFAGKSISAGAFRGVCGLETDSRGGIRNFGRLCTIDSVSARGQRIVKAGPDTAQVEVWDRDWHINGRTLQMRQTYTMLNGHRDVQVDIYLDGGTDQDIYATGVQKLEMQNEGLVVPGAPVGAGRGDASSQVPECAEPGTASGALVGSWGRNIPDKAHPELVEGLGIGVFVPQSFLVATHEDDLNYLCYLHPVNGHIRYHLAVAADMEKTGGFHSSRQWFDWLQKWSVGL